MKRRGRTGSKLFRHAPFALQVALKADNLDPTVADLCKQTVCVLKRLEEHAHLLYKEMRSLQRAAEIAEEMVSQLKPEFEESNLQDGSLRKTSGPQDRFGIGSLQLFGLEIEEPHAAMTDTQLQEIKKAAEAARGQRKLQLDALKWLSEPLSTACGEHVPTQPAAFALRRQPYLLVCVF